MDREGEGKKERKGKTDRQTDRQTDREEEWEREIGTMWPSIPGICQGVPESY